MVTGRVPFTANTPIEVCLKHLTETLPQIAQLAPDLPKSFAHLIHLMLEKDPTQRPQNGNEVSQLLAAIERELDLLEAPTETLGCPHQQANRSSLCQVETTLAAFELAGFSKISCCNLPPARVAFLLESWYRLVRRAVADYDGLVDRCVADRVTT